MPPHILLILVVGGIGLIALLLYLTGRSTQTVMSAEEARNTWLRQIPEDGAHQVQTLIGMGLVWAFGADTVARHLTGFDLADTPRGLRVNFHEFGAPSSSLTLTETEHAD